VLTFLFRNKTDFLCKMQFRNKLPDIPFDPKLLVLPLDPARHTKCIIGSSLENSYKHTLFTEPDLGIPINLIDANMYKIPPGMSGKQALAPEDQALVDTSSAPRKGTPARPRPAVTWLRKTNYLCNEEDLPQFKAKGVEAQPGAYKLLRAGQQPPDLNTLDGQIRSVEDTFEAVKRTPTHPTNPTARPVEILPIFPDFTLWPNAYTEVVFDSDPLNTLTATRLEGMDAEERDYLRNHAVVRGIPNTHQLVAFITPKNNKRPREEPLPEEEFEQVHAFHFDVAKDADLKDNYFFVFTPDAVYYNELATRVKLRKVQSKEEKEQLLSIPRPSSVSVVSNEMTEETQAERAERLSEMLQPASLMDAADA
jgi:RNA polymerase II-associated factor 1